MERLAGGRRSEELDAREVNKGKVSSWGGAEKDFSKFSEFREKKGMEKTKKQIWRDVAN